MSKQEFLQRLRMALNGEVPGNVIEENLRYYDEYISTEAAKGLAEADVTASIGDPRLIAKTIIDVSETADEGSSGRGGFYDSRQNDSETVYNENGKIDRSFHTIDLSKWYWKLLATVAVVLVVVVIFFVIGGIFSVLIPLVGPILMILVVFSFIRNMRR